MVKEDCKLHVFTCVHVLYIVKVRRRDKNDFSRTNFNCIYVVPWAENGHLSPSAYDKVQFSRIRVPVRFSDAIRFQSQEIECQPTKNSEIILISQGYRTA